MTMIDQFSSLTTLIVNEMPFSGIGTSGCECELYRRRIECDFFPDGYQVGYLGYLNFTHLKSTIEIPKEYVF